MFQYRKSKWKNYKVFKESSSFYKSNQPNENEELQIITEKELDIIDELIYPLKALDMRIVIFRTLDTKFSKRSCIVSDFFRWCS